jgi:hypothetical protein
MRYHPELLAPFPKLVFSLGERREEFRMDEVLHCNQLNIRSSITSDSDLYVETDELPKLTRQEIKYFTSGALR